MKVIQGICVAVFVTLFLFSGCTGKKKNVQFPDTSPEEVVLKFFDLLKTRGRLTSEAALRMVSKKFGEVNPDNFRKWTEKYSGESEIKPVETVMPRKPDKNGYWIATVKLEISTPSKFGDPFKTYSNMNLILDQDAGEWKVDFLAETISEEDHRRAPTEAFVETKKVEK